MWTVRVLWAEQRPRPACHCPPPPQLWALVLGRALWEGRVLFPGPKDTPPNPTVCGSV